MYKTLQVFLTLAAAASSHAAVLHVAHAGAAKAAGCDYYVITDAMFSTQADRLAEMRHKLTPGVAAQPCVAKMADIYHDYPPRPEGKWTSLQDFLKAAHAAHPELAHVALLGGASLDESSPDNHVPTATFRVPSLTRQNYGDTAMDTLTTDDAYSSFVDSLPDVEAHPLAFAVGRIPARTTHEADVYLDKLEAYETHFAYGPNAFTYGYVNDDDLQGGGRYGVEPITMLPDEHLQLWDSLKVKPFVRRMLSIEFPVNQDWEKPKAEDSVIGLLNSSPARVYYIGHGSAHQLADEKLFQVPEDLPRLKPKALQPIVAMLTSLSARFAAVEYEPMGSQLLFDPNGAVAFLGGTIWTYPLPNNELFRHFDRRMFDGGTVGRALARAKDSIYDARDDIFDALNDVVYVLLGDPALSAHVPAFDLAPAVGSGASRLVLEGAGQAGDSAYFQLVQIDSLPYNPIISPLNQDYRDRYYPSETIVAEGRAVLGAGGSVTFSLPAAANPKAAAVKVMTWNSQGMRYGHFPLETLGTAVRPMARGALMHPGYRMVLSGSNLVFEGHGRRIGLNGRDVAR